jgi:hypothetical protein
MQHRTNDLKNQAKNLYKKTLAGPGKFGIFILLCIMIIFSFEQLGLTNKESNIEMRSVNKRVIPVKIQSQSQEKKRAKKVHNAKDNSNSFDDKIKIFTEIDNSRRILNRQNILISGAIDQNDYETSVPENFENVNSTTNFNQELFMDA